MPATSAFNSEAGGIWTLRDAERLKRAGTWPVTDDEFFSSVSLLLHMDGANDSATFTDSSPNAFAVTAVGNAKISTAQSKFGGSSALFDGNGDYLELGGQSAFAFGTGDWTVECWIYLTQIDQIEQIFDFRQPGDGPVPVSKINIALVDGNPVLYVLQDVRIQGTVTISINQWYHLAVARASGTTRMFVDGVQTGDAWSDSTSYTVQGSRPAIGANGENPGGSSPFNGHMDEIRITKGIARYTANFTPSTFQFPDR